MMSYPMKGKMVSHKMHVVEEPNYNSDVGCRWLTMLRLLQRKPWTVGSDVCGGSAVITSALLWWGVWMNGEALHIWRK